jgi:hypothetical protein
MLVARSTLVNLWSDPPLRQAVLFDPPEIVVGLLLSSLQRRFHGSDCSPFRHEMRGSYIHEPPANKA